MGTVEHKFKHPICTHTSTLRIPTASGGGVEATKGPEMATHLSYSTLFSSLFKPVRPDCLPASLLAGGGGDGGGIRNSVLFFA
jgi:hypothetical protein